MAFSTLNSFHSYSKNKQINVKTTTFLNITSWYNPNNVTFSTSNFVNTWIDATGHNNLTVVTNPSGLKKVGNNIQFSDQSSIASTSSFTPFVGGVIFNVNTNDYIPKDPSLNELFSLGYYDNGIRRGVFDSAYIGGSDIQAGNGNTYVNGTSVQINDASNNNSTITMPTPVGNRTIYSQFATIDQQGGVPTNSAKNIILGAYDSNNDAIARGASIGRGPTQVSLGHFFLVTPSITILQQQFIEGYLGYVYQTQSKLPVTHPYYSANNNHALDIVVG
jgi:hypothetical protein